MPLEKLLEMGGKEWTDSELVYDENGILSDANGNKYSRKVSKHRVYFNDGDNVLEAIGIDGFGQKFYFDLLENTWAGELCGYEIDKMNEGYK